MVEQISIFRLIRRRVIAESNDPVRIVELAFKNDEDEIDPELSVYAIKPDGVMVTQVMSEHTAFSNLDPTARGAIDISHLFSVECVKEDDGGCFQLRRGAHHILLFRSDPEDALRIATALVDKPLGRFWIAETNQVREYGKRRYNASDIEWIDAANQSEKIRLWVTKLPDLKINIQALIYTSIQD